MNDVAFDLPREKAKFGADGVGGESCAEKAARDGSEPALIERAANMREQVLQADTHECGFVGLGEDAIERGIDMAVGNAAAAQLPGYPKTALVTGLGVLASEVGGVARVVEVGQFSQARDDGRNDFFVVGAAFKMLTHFMD